MSGLKYAQVKKQGDIERAFLEIRIDLKVNCSSIAIEKAVRITDEIAKCNKRRRKCIHIYGTVAQAITFISNVEFFCSHRREPLSAIRPKY